LIKRFGDAKAIIFVVNIASYDGELSGSNQLMEALNLFKWAIHSRWFKKPSIILLLNKTKEFKKKLPKSPLSREFPDYTGGTDMDLAATYILKHFVQINRPDLKLHPYLVDLNHILAIQDLVISAVKEVVFTEGISKTPKLRKWK
jgi:guanine nucleotide-binding protein G(i) subunit alpha